MRKILSFSTMIIVIVVTVLTLFIDNLYAFEIGGGSGKPGNAYNQTVKCIKTVRTHSTTCACFTDPSTGYPAFNHNYSEVQTIYYRDATLCRFNYVTSEFCTETNPCIE